MRPLVGDAAGGEFIFTDDKSNRIGVGKYQIVQCYMVPKGMELPEVYQGIGLPQKAMGLIGDEYGVHEIHVRYGPDGS